MIKLWLFIHPVCLFRSGILSQVLKKLGECLVALAADKVGYGQDYTYHAQSRFG